MLLNYHIGRFVLVSLCVGDLAQLGLSSIRVAGFSLQHRYYSSAGRMDEFPDQRLCYSLWSILPALNFHQAATREPDGLYGKQCYHRELLMMGIMVPETC